MIWEWMAVKGPSLIAFLVGIGLIGIAYLEIQYRYFFVACAIIAFVYGYKQLRRHDTPFQKHEREMRRKQM
jgi:hypothetical protein